MFIDLDELKTHCRIEHDFHEDDVYLMGLVEAGIEAIKKEVDIIEDDELLNCEGQLKPNIKHALFMLVSYWYENRETGRPGSL